jgi:hypothetical protein
VSSLHLATRTPMWLGGGREEKVKTTDTSRVSTLLSNSKLPPVVIATAAARAAAPMPSTSAKVSSYGASIRAAMFGPPSRMSSLDQPAKQAAENL